MPAFSTESVDGIPELPSALGAKFRPLSLDGNYPYLLLLTNFGVVLRLKGDMDLRWCKLVILWSILNHLTNTFLSVLELTELASITGRVVVWVLWWIYNEIWNHYGRVRIHTKSVILFHLRSGVQRLFVLIIEHLQILAHIVIRFQLLTGWSISLMASLFAENVGWHLLFNNWIVAILWLVGEHFFLLLHQELLFAVFDMPLGSFFCEFPVAIWALDFGEPWGSFVHWSVVQIRIFFQRRESTRSSGQVVFSSWVQSRMSRNCCSCLSFLLNSLQLVSHTEMGREHSLLRRLGPWCLGRLERSGKFRGRSLFWGQDCVIWGSLGIFRNTHSKSLWRSFPGKSTSPLNSAGSARVQSIVYRLCFIPFSQRHFIVLFLLLLLVSCA